MNAASSIVLTSHAIDRFRSRHAPHLTHVEAARELQAYLPDAVKIDEKSILGQDQWLIAEPYGVVLVCKNDPKVGIVAVTSLHLRMCGPSAEDLEELKAATVREALARVAALPERAPRVFVKPAKLPKPVDPEKQARGMAKMAENIALQAEASARAKTERAATKAVRREKVDALVAQATLHNAKVERLKSGHAKHCEHMDRDRNKLRNLLRIVLIAAEPFVGADPGITEAWDSIAASDPGLLSDEFLAWREPIAAE